MEGHEENVVEQPMAGVTWQHVGIGMSRPESLSFDSQLLRQYSAHIHVVDPEEATGRGKNPIGQISAAVFRDLTSSDDLHVVAQLLIQKLTYRMHSL